MKTSYYVIKSQYNELAPVVIDVRDDKTDIIGRCLSYMIKLEAAVEGKWNVWYEEVDYEKEIL
jgi:hypothetical protein